MTRVAQAGGPTRWPASLRRSLARRGVNGCQNTAIAGWAALKEGLLTPILDPPHGIPGKDVFRRMLMMLRPDTFEAAFNAWSDRRRHDAVVAMGIDRPIIALDGKSARRSHDANHDLGAPRLGRRVWSVRGKADRVLSLKRSCRAGVTA